MFAQDQPKIAAHGSTPEGFADVVSFVIATQNQFFYRVGSILDLLYTDGLDACRYLNSGQKRGIAYVTERAPRILHALHCAHSSLDALRLLIEMPHVGIVKAGFILQLLKGQVGCLDRHNLKALGLAPKSFNRAPTSAVALTERLQLYEATCTQLGTPEMLYDGWCRFIALRYPRQFPSAQSVSTAHVVCCRARKTVARRVHKAAPPYRGTME